MVSGTEVNKLYYSLVKEVGLFQCLVNNCSIYSAKSLEIFQHALLTMAVVNDKSQNLVTRVEVLDTLFVSGALLHVGRYYIFFGNIYKYVVDYVIVIAVFNISFCDEKLLIFYMFETIQTLYSAGKTG